MLSCIDSLMTLGCAVSSARNPMNTSGLLIPYPKREMPVFGIINDHVVVGIIVCHAIRTIHDHHSPFCRRQPG